jgi:hypothetical protein
MGLAGFGTPDPEPFADILTLIDDPMRPVRIDLSFFEYHLGHSGLSRKGLNRFGEPRAAGTPFTERHRNLASSVQRVLETAIIHLVRNARELLPDEANMCLSGGVALNVSSNRLIRDSGDFENLFIIPPAYDGGTSLGCALHLDSKHSGRRTYSFDVYSGPDIVNDFDIENGLRRYGDSIVWERLAEGELIERAARALAEHKIIGWMQGRMECGPRALGNRSILANPTRPEAKDRLNAGIKKRETFRPYAPSVLREESANWFDVDDSPHMLFEASVHTAKRGTIPAVVHVDGSSRPQTVTPTSNPRYYKLLRHFFERTGVPVLLNTSFNQHGEPLVNRPEEAVAVLLATELDELFIGDYHVKRNPTVSFVNEWVSIDGRGIWKCRAIPGAIDDRQVQPYTGARIARREFIEVTTDPVQWGYAVGFRLQSHILRAEKMLQAILVRVRIEIQSGKAGIIFVRDDLQTVLGTSAETGVDGAHFLDILIEPPPQSGWLVIRNAAAGQASRFRVYGIEVYRATWELPEVDGNSSS